MTSLPIERLDLSGVAQVVAWAESEGWEPGLTDAQPFYAADPEGFFRSAENGQTVATISIVRGGTNAAFVGSYIVDPEYRGKNHGRALWDEALSRFKGFALGLDAVAAQVGAYASHGFVPTYANVRYAGTSLPEPDATVEVVSADSVPFEELVAFDGAHFLGPRPEFLESWIRGDDRDAVIVVDDGEITGFAASRRTSAGHRIGPVFAHGADLARALILKLAADVEGPIKIDVPRPNLEAVRLLGSLGMEPGFETTRMYRGAVPALPLTQIFGVTTLELG